MQTLNNAAVHTLPSAHENQRVEMVIEDGDRVALRYETWTEGLGWCCQKTIRINAEQLDDLHRAVTVARHRLNLKRASEGRPSAPAHVIKLPTLA